MVKVKTTPSPPPDSSSPVHLNRVVDELLKLKFVGGKAKASSSSFRRGGNVLYEFSHRAHSPMVQVNFTAMRLESVTACALTVRVNADGGISRWSYDDNESMRWAAGPVHSQLLKIFGCPPGE